MRTEARRSFRYGFVLTETELRRLVDEISEQLKQLCPDDDFTISFGVKFRNGAVTEPGSLEEILSEENHGSGRISRVQILGTANNLENTSITVVFIDCAQEDTVDTRAISYKVEADRNDWVFVTGSKLEERIDKIKRLSFRSTRSTPTLLIAMLAMFFPMFIGLALVGSQKRNALINVERKIDRGELTDPLTALLELERARIGEGWFGTSPEMTMIMVMIFLIVFVVGTAGFITYCYPTYNFCWGDYTETFKRRRATGNLVFGSVLLALVVTVTGNYISKFFP